MKLDSVIDFILTGLYLEIPFGPHTTRMLLERKLGSIEGFNKKNGVSEILEKDGIFFYLGFGTRGAFEGIRITRLLSHQIELSSIEGLLKKNSISFKLAPKESILLIENGMEILFQRNEKDETRYVQEILKAENSSITDKLMKIKI